MKRFTETTKWVDPWFTDLSLPAKLLWFYLLDNCDNAGVIRFNSKVASVQIGQTIEDDHFTELGDRVQTLEGGKLWIPAFIPFQYGRLSPDCRPHIPVIELVSKHGLNLSASKPFVKGINTLEEKEKDKDKEKDNTKEGGTRGKPPTLDEVKEFVSKSDLPESDAVWFWNKCEANGWLNGGRKIKSWTHTIVAWKAAGYMPSQKHGNGAPVNGKPMSPLDYRTIILAKEAQATELYNRHCSESALSKIWDSQANRDKFATLRREIKELNIKLGALGGSR